MANCSFYVLNVLLASGSIYIMRTTHGIPCACELDRYVVSSIPLDIVHMFWWRLSFSNQCLSESEVCITQEMKAIFKQFKVLDICDNVVKKWMTKQQRSMRHDSSYFEYVDALHSVIMDKWINITNMSYVIASRYNIVLVSLSLQQSMTFFPLRN
ncbi:hypothetical protein HKD37_20G056390 [Glycine soja]